MPTNCSVRGCAGSNINKSYFTLPAVFKFKQCPPEKAELSKQRRQLWLEALGLRDDDSAFKIRVCSDHFLTGRPSALEDSNNIDWVPSLHMHLPSILSNRKRKAKPVEHSTTGILVKKRIASKNFRSYGLRRSEQKKFLNCRVLLDGNLRCTSFNGTNGSGLTIIQKHGKFTSDNVTLRETAINNTILRVRLFQEDLYNLKRKYNITNRQKKGSVLLRRNINRKSSSYDYNPDYSTSFDQPPYEVNRDMKAKPYFGKRDVHITSTPAQNLKVILNPTPRSILESRLLMSKQAQANNKTLNRVIRKNDRDKIRVKFFPKSPTSIRRPVKNGTIQDISDHSQETHREILFINQYKSPLMLSPTPENVGEYEPTYYLKMGPSRKFQETMLDYPFQKLVTDVKHMKLPGPSWKIKVIIRQGKIVALTFTNKQELERLVSFTVNSNKFNVVLENKPVLFLGAPLTLRCVEDLEALLDIVETIEPKDCMLLYK